MVRRGTISIKKNLNNMTVHNITIDNVSKNYILFSLKNGMQYKDPFGDYLDAAVMGVTGVELQTDITQSVAAIGLAVFRTKENYEGWLKREPYNQFRSVHGLRFNTNASSKVLPFSIFDMNKFNDNWVYGLEVTTEFWDIIKELPNPEIPNEKVKDRWELV